MRRNGFLAVRPDEKGHLTWCGDQNWCASMPLGSSRIPSAWLSNRLAHIQQDGAFVPEPIWDRMRGATELADLIEWSYHNPAHENADMDINIEEADQVDWVQAGKFQLPLELRRQLAIREKTMSQGAREKRDKIREKRKARKIRMDAKKQITEEEREKINQDLQSKSRYETMSSMAPPAHEDKPAISEELPKGTFRIVSDQANDALYGRQGSVLSIGKEKYQLILQKDKRHQKEQLAWVSSAWLQEVDEKLPAWSWPQLALSRYLKSEILKDAGTISEDVATIPEWDSIEIIQEKIMPAGGLEAQTIIFGFHLLCTVLNKKVSGPYKGFHMISPALPASVRLQHHEGIDSEKILKALKHEMSDKNQIYLFPLNSGHHWTLMVLDLPQQSIRYYDSINGDLSEACLALAEIMLGYLMEHDIINPENFKEHAGIARTNTVRQPMQSNMCGHFVLAFMEEEMCRAEFGPAATEHPLDSARAWHSRLAKLTQALMVEYDRRKIDIVSDHQKLEAQGEKLHKERMKQYELAKKRLNQGLELNALMEEAYKQIHEHKRTLFFGKQTAMQLQAGQGLARVTPSVPGGQNPAAFGVVMPDYQVKRGAYSTPLEGISSAPGVVTHVRALTMTSLRRAQEPATNGGSTGREATTLRSVRSDLKSMAQFCTQNRLDQATGKVKPRIAGSDTPRSGDAPQLSPADSPEKQEARSPEHRSGSTTLQSTSVLTASKSLRGSANSRPQLRNGGTRTRSPSATSFKGGPAGGPASPAVAPTPTRLFQSRNDAPGGPGLAAAASAGRPGVQTSTSPRTTGTAHSPKRKITQSLVVQVRPRSGSFTSGTPGHLSATGSITSPGRSKATVRQTSAGAAVRKRSGPGGPLSSPPTAVPLPRIEEEYPVDDRLDVSAASETTEKRSVTVVTATAFDETNVVMCYDPQEDTTRSVSLGRGAFFSGPLCERKARGRVAQAYRHGQ
eukprot:s761_g23.t1